MAEPSHQPSGSLPSEPAATETAKDLLQRGFQALNQQSYVEAIEAFQAIDEIAAAEGDRIKAKMGLVQAYQRTGAVAAAIQLCHALSEHRHHQIQQWAKQKLSILTAQATPASQPTPESASWLPPAPATQPSPPPEATPPTGPTSNSFGIGPISINDPSGHNPSSLDPSEFIPWDFPYQTLPPLGDEAPPSMEQGIPFQKPAPRLLKSLPRPNRNTLKRWFVEGITALALFWLLQQILHLGLQAGNWFLIRLEDIIPQLPIRPFDLDEPPTRLILVALLGLTLVSPWLMDTCLRQIYGCHALPPGQLNALSPEAAILIRRVCQQQGWPLPTLSILPCQEPICLSYGWLPRNTRIVVSQGLIDRLGAEELATLYAYEIGHSLNWDRFVMSGLGILLLLIYQGYWQLSQWADRQAQPPVRNLFGAGAAVCYSLFWLIRKVGLWWSRVRSEACDRIAVILTNHPEEYRRSLIKLTQGIAETINQQGFTSPLLESLDILTPLSHQMALSPGSCLSATNLSALTLWDRQNPYRHWLTWNTPHPLLGERLQWLAQYTPEMGTSDPTTEKASQTLEMAPRTIRLAQRTTGLNYLPPLLLQGSPVVGVLVGLGLAMLIWFIGGIAPSLNWWPLSLLYADTGVLRGSWRIGFGIGLMLRINHFFPDIHPAAILKNPTIETLLKKPIALPTDSQPIQLQGVLIGRTGVANWLCQDLILRTSSGLVRLHILTALGPLGNFLHHGNRPVQYLGQSLIVTGWIRRGASLWLDTEKFQSPRKIVKMGNLPLWATTLSLSSCLWGILILLRGY